MAEKDEKGASGAEKPSTDQPKGEQAKGAEAAKEQPKSKGASKVRSTAERLRRNPWR